MKETKMMKRGFAAKAAAVLMAAGAITAGGALFAAPAWANLSDITIFCQSVNFHYTLFSSSGATATEQVTINGSVFTSKQFTFTGTEAFDTIAIPGVTGDVVIASASWVDATEGPGSKTTPPQTLTGCQAPPTTTTTTAPATTTTEPATTTTVPATTTIPPTSTTVPDTTTTVPATTTIPPTTTTQPPTSATAPLEATTTTEPTVTTIPATAPETALAFTGANTGLDLEAGGALIALGTAAVVVAKRRRRQ
jgi:hypothetical protein